MNFEREDRIKGLLAKGVNNGVFPGAVLIAANGGKLISFQAVGKRSLFFRSGSMKEDTIFDLASLTKPLATTLALMKCNHLKVCWSKPFQRTKKVSLHG